MLTKTNQKNPEGFTVNNKGNITKSMDIGLAYN